MQDPEIQNILSDPVMRQVSTIQSFKKFEMILVNPV